MSDLSNLVSNVNNFFPWVSFLAGLGGSLHCVGMCGGLVTASCEKSPDVMRYQFGRLLGYLILGLSAGLLGSLVKIENASPLIAMIPGVFIGLLFLFWGVQNLRGKKAELPMPRFMGKFYSFLWKKLVFKNIGVSKAFFTGLISIFLPCGLLYGVVLGSVAIQHPLTAMVSMFFFWLGTTPSMVIAPQLFQKFLKPFKNSLPKTYAISLILIGVMTVSFRMIKYSEHQEGHQLSLKAQSTQMMCH